MGGGQDNVRSDDARGTKTRAAAIAAAALVQDRNDIGRELRGLSGGTD